VCADESLARVIPIRPLTAEEAGQMLEHALSVLAYIHGQGFVHANKPVNHVQNHIPGNSHAALRSDL
jgi:hypothetical protein